VNDSVEEQGGQYIEEAEETNMNNVTTSASNPESPQAVNELDSSFDIKPSAEVANHLNARMKYL